MKAMIFAAGLGTRLKPFTDSHPKALAPVAGKPALQRAIANIKAVGISTIYVNVHHFADQIEQFLADNGYFGLDIKISDERDQLLDTGGGLAKVITEFGPSEPLLVCNADIATDLNFGEMVSRYESECPDAMLLTAIRDSSRQLYFTHEGMLAGWKNLKDGSTRPEGFVPDERFTPLAFGGIHIVGTQLQQALAKQWKTEKVFPIMPFYLSKIQEYHIVSYTPEKSYRWFDIGNPDKLNAATAAFSENN